MTRRTISTLTRISDLLEDIEQDYAERASYFADNGKESAARWNERMHDRVQKAMERLEALLDEDDD